MSQDQDQEEIRFLDYGDGGDIVGTKRQRRSFLLCVFGIVLLVFGMYIIELEVRFGHVERLYVSGITLADKSSARPVLRQAVKIDADTNEKPTAKYTQALAVREQDDVILSRFNEAQAIDDRNALFTIRHGSRLFIMGHPAEALKQYQVAEQLLISSEPNAFPKYLQAAAKAQISHLTDTNPVSFMTELTTANGREGDMVCPEPFWFSPYPKHGIQYAQLQREIINETCAPLYVLSASAVKSIEEKILLKQYDDARMWIGSLNTLGERLLTSSQPVGTIQASEGIRILILCNQLLEKVETAQEGNVAKETLENGFKLNAMRDELVRYERDRDDAIQMERSRVSFPNIMAFAMWFVSFGTWMFLLCLSRFIQLRDSAWSIRFNSFGRLFLVWGNILLLVLLCIYNFLSTSNGFSVEYLTILNWVWVVTALIIILMGLIVPATMLKNPEEATRNQTRPGEMERIYPFARVAYRQSYLTLVLRYYGNLAGIFTVTLCAWILIYRLSQGLYPWQVILIAKGFLDQEADLVEQLLQTF